MNILSCFFFFSLEKNFATIPEDVNLSNKNKLINANYEQACYK